MKTILLLIYMMLSIANVSSQTNYYTHTQKIIKDGYTYQCDVPTYGLVTLYNINNKWTNTPQINTKLGENYIHPDVYVPLFEDDNWTRSKRFSIVNNAFSATEKKRVKDSKMQLVISMYISPDTGKVVEVDFSFLTLSPYATIPISVYREIEVELKKSIWFTLTPLGKQLNYILYWWNQEPE